MAKHRSKLSAHNTAILKLLADIRRLLDAARAGGATELELQTVDAQAADFARMYENPLYRLPITFVEIFPVGVLISLVSAGLLRNSRFLPARGRA